jgi:hypothetical protein
MEKCNKCNALTGMFFERNYKPDEYLLGKRNSKVWIIGLNPKGVIGYNDLNETIECLENFKLDHQYFKDFKYVSKRIFENMGEEYGVAHTDLIKCFSKIFPPSKLSTTELHEILCNCRMYLSEQLKKHEPKIIICNGSHVVWHLEQIIPIKKDFETYYIGDTYYEPIVFRSGFIGRIDNFAKRRLGKEIETILNETKILN